MEIHRITKHSSAFFLIGEILSLNTSFLIALLTRFNEKTPLSEEYYDYYVQLFLLLNTTWIALFLNSWKTKFPENFTSLSNSFNKRWLGLLIIYALLIVILKGYYFSRIFAGILFVLHLIFGNILLLIVSKTIRYFQKKTKEIKILLIYESNAKPNEIENAINKEFHYKANVDKINFQKDILLTENIGKKYEVVISEIKDMEKLLEIQRWCDINYINHYIFFSEFQPIFRSAELIKYVSATFLKIRDEPLNLPLNKFVKYFSDIVLSVLFLIVLSPLMLLLYIILFIKWNKTPIFKQKRYGQNGKIFTIYKYKTMENNSTPAICRFMRKFSLDELPQLINVLKGDMSIVGPRPYHLEDITKFKEKSKIFMVRHWVKPGITGLAQIRGYRGKITDDYHFEERLRNDVWYIENWSLTLDLKILVLTIFQIPKGT
jgi:putative colanic acid biosynthesis UDP-glucose lipid carrier transferase